VLLATKEVLGLTIDGCNLSQRRLLFLHTFVFLLVHGVFPAFRVVAAAKTSRKMSHPNVTEAEMAKCMAAIQQGEGKNGRNIPAMTFIPDVASFLKQHDMKIEVLFQNLATMREKYRFMSKRLQDTRVAIMAKVPENERTLKTVQHLMKKAADDEEVKASFPLADSVYVDATVSPDQGTVYLWLGANVLLEYVLERYTCC